MQNAVRGLTLERLYKLAVVFFAALIFCVVALVVGRMVIYKIAPYERGLHLSGGRFVGVDDPGWHAQIPFWDQVIVVEVNERQGYVERIPAMTSDDVTMVVSLQYTYIVTEPAKYALEVADPERILFEFVQGRLRDVVNTKPMTEVMHLRAEMNDQVMNQLRTKEQQYGVKFITVQIQSATPPDEVVTAIKDRMVAIQKKEQAQAEADQIKTRADADFYAAQKRAEASAYEINKTADARRASIEMLLAELSKHPEIASKYLDYLMTQELKENSKWIIGGGGMTPLLNLSEEGTAPKTGGQ
jgi:membrane protease subunit HflK